jgi:hypothetical protein
MSGNSHFVVTSSVAVLLVVFGSLNFHILRNHIYSLF